MATGPQHYKQAETCLDSARSEDYGSEREGYYLAAAQAHATLALAAAMGTYGTDETRTNADTAAWERVAGEYTVQQRRRSAAEKAEQLEAEQAGREIDQAVESTGHLPGYADNESEAE
jgi:hypothetical protein